MNKNITIVIPIYNAQKYLIELENVLTQHHALKTYNILLVDDGSKKKSREQLVSLKEKYSNVNFIFLKRNLGQHLASIIGVKYSKTEKIFTLDQDMIPHIHKFLNYINIEFQEKKFVYFTTKKKRSLFRNLSSKVLLLVIRYFGFNKLRGIYSARLIHKKDTEDIKIHSKFILDLELLKRKLQPKYIQTTIIVEEKSSSYSLLKSFMLFLIIAFNYSFFIETLIFLVAMVLSFYSNFLWSSLFILAIIPISLHKLRLWKKIEEIEYESEIE